MATNNQNLTSAIIMLMLAIISIQASASFAKVLFETQDTIVVSTIRLLLGSFILGLIGKIWTIQFKKAQWRPLIFYGLALAGMNGFFYLSLSKLPLGIAVSFEFIGPLSLALYHAKQKIDRIWIGLAILGMILLFPFSEASQSFDLLGVVYAIVAGAFWAGYILSGQKKSGLSSNQTVCLGMFIGTLVLLPFAMFSGTLIHIFEPELLISFFILAVLSSAIPFSLEMVVLKRLPPLVFGTLTSLDPVFAAISGVLLLKEHLLWSQWFALTIIIIASIGCTYTTHRAKHKLK